MKTNFEALAKSDNQDDFLNAVADINSRGETLQLDIQRYMTAVAMRWHETGDVRPAVLRINALIDRSKRFKGARWNAVLAYVEAAFGFIYVMEGENAHTFIKGKISAKKLDMAMFTVQSNFWWNFAPEPEYTPMNLQEEIAKLIKRAEGCMKEGSKRGLEGAEQLQALKALVPAEEPNH